MALITCPKCGRMISTKADYCPQCGWRVELFNNNNTYDNNTGKSYGNGYPDQSSSGKKINMTAVLIAAIIALAAIACAALLRNGSSEKSQDVTSETPMTDSIQPQPSQGWKYDIQDNEVVASILSDNAPVTMKIIANAEQDTSAVVVASKELNFKDNDGNKQIGITFNGTTQWCEVQRDEDAGEPTYKITLKSNLINEFKSNTKFSLIFDDEEVTFSSSNPLNMPSLEQIQQPPIIETTSAQSPKPSTQPRPQQESTRASSEQRSQARNDQPSQTQTIDIEDEQPVDKVFADPEQVRNIPKPSEQQRTNTTGELPPSVKEKLKEQRNNDDEEE